MGECRLQQTVVCDAIFLKAVEEACWCVFHLRFLDNHNTLEVRVNMRGFCVSPNGNVGVITNAPFWIFNLAEVLIE